jgi:hypothetical protein
MYTSITVSTEKTSGSFNKNHEKRFGTFPSLFL